MTRRVCIGYLAGVYFTAFGGKVEGAEDLKEVCLVEESKACFNTQESSTVQVIHQQYLYHCPCSP
jgi:hypothetical protein